MRSFLDFQRQQGLGFCKIFFSQKGLVPRDYKEINLKIFKRFVHKKVIALYSLKTSLKKNYFYYDNNCTS